MPSDPSHPIWVKRDQALDLVMAQRGQAVIPIAAGDTSMLPHLRGGDAVLVAPPSTPRAPGALLLFRQSDYWVVHRYLGTAIVRDGRQGLRTRGDGRNALDPLVAAEDVRARVIAFRRGGTWWSLEGRAARVYARLVAWHDLFWAAIGVAARPTGLSRAVAAIDLGLLKFARGIIFPMFHGRIPAPAGSLPDEPV